MVISLITSNEQVLRIVDRETTFVYTIKIKKTRIPGPGNNRGPIHAPTNYYTREDTGPNKYKNKTHFQVE